MAVLLIGCLPMLGAPTPPVTQPTDNSADQSTGLSKVFSDKPFFGTEKRLTLGGTYVNTPNEDFQETSVWDAWSLPLSLEDMHGMIAELSFGGSEKQGQWQLTYRHKMFTADSDWQAIANANNSLSLSERRSQVLKASYNFRDWWKVGVSAVVEDRYGAEPTLDLTSFGPNGHDSLGFQIDTLLKF